MVLNFLLVNLVKFSCPGNTTASSLYNNFTITCCSRDYHVIITCYNNILPSVRVVNVTPRPLTTTSTSSLTTTTSPSRSIYTVSVRDKDSQCPRDVRISIGLASGAESASFSKVLETYNPGSGQCPFCNQHKKFLRSHIKIVHFKVKRHACLECNTKFSVLTNLKSHLYYSHKMDFKEIERVIATIKMKEDMKKKNAMYFVD